MDCSKLFKILLYGQISGKQSLREIETWLWCHDTKLYHMWILSSARSTIWYWNKKVDSTVYENMFSAIYKKYSEVCIVKNPWFNIKAIAMDSTLISLAIWVYDWAKHRTRKGWIRVHVWLELDRCIPRFVVIKEWLSADNVVAREMIEQWKLWEWECIVFDKYYVDFKLWKMIDDRWSFFVTRTKKNTDYVIMDRKESNEAWITLDAKVLLMWTKGMKEYPQDLRIVRYYHKEHDKEYEYITNDFEHSAGQIAQIYENRWRIEEFFRWIKQNLKIKTFLGSSENAVKNQIWVAMIYYMITHYLSYIGKLWKQQILRLMRILKEKCMVWIGVSELLSMARWGSCISSAAPPPWTLFSF